MTGRSGEWKQLQIDEGRTFAAVAEIVTLFPWEHGYTICLEIFIVGLWGCSTALSTKASRIGQDENGDYADDRMTD